MMDHGIDSHEPPTVLAPRLYLPSVAPATPEEFERRRALFAEIDRIRASTGSFDISVDELIDADFYELDADCE